MKGCYETGRETVRTNLCLFVRNRIQVSLVSKTLATPGNRAGVFHKAILLSGTLCSFHQAKFQCGRGSPQTPLSSPNSPRPVLHVGGLRWSSIIIYHSFHLVTCSFKVNTSSRAIEHSNKECGLWNQMFPVYILCLMHASCVALGK